MCDEKTAFFEGVDEWGVIESEGFLEYVCAGVGLENDEDDIGAVRGDIGAVDIEGAGGPGLSRKYSVRARRR